MRFKGGLTSLEDDEGSGIGLSSFSGDSFLTVEASVSFETLYMTPYLITVNLSKHVPNLCGRFVQFYAE